MWAPLPSRVSRFPRGGEEEVVSCICCPFLHEHVEKNVSLVTAVWITVKMCLISCNTELGSGGILRAVGGSLWIKRRQIGIDAKITITGNLEWVVYARHCPKNVASISSLIFTTTVWNGHYYYYYEYHHSQFSEGKPKQREAQPLLLKCQLPAFLLPKPVSSCADSGVSFSFTKESPGTQIFSPSRREF